MQTMHENPYTFTIDGVDGAYFTVRSFTGTETMSNLYSFKLLLSGPAAATDEIERTILGQRGTFTWLLGSEPRAFYGVVAAVRVIGPRDGKHTAYEVEFVPRLWLLK